MSDSSLYTYNIIIAKLREFADNHALIRKFTHGQISQADLEKEDEFPFMHVVPNQFSIDAGQLTYSLEVVFADLPRDKELKTEYQRHSISDCVLLFADLVNEIENGQIFDESVIITKPITFTPFIEEFSNVLSGVQGSIDITVDYEWNACDIPYIAETVSVFSQVIDFELYPVYNSIRYLCDGEQVAVCYSAGGFDNIPQLVALFNSNPGTDPSCENPEVCFCWSNYGTYYDNGDGRIRCEMPIAVANELCPTGELTLDIIRD